MEVCKRGVEDQLDRSLNNEDMLHRDKEERNIIHRKNVRTGHILHRNCLLYHVVERKIERTVKRGSRGKHILGELRKRAGTGTCKRKPWPSSHTLKNSVWKRLWTCRKASGCDDKQSQNPQTQWGREGCTKSGNVAHVRICTSGIPTALLNSCLSSIRKSFNMHRFSLRSVHLYDQFLINHGLRFLLICLPLFLLQTNICRSKPNKNLIYYVNIFNWDLSGK